MNCEQARSLLSAYRELRDGEFDTTELDVHLERCASCRQTLARDMFIGERVRDLPALEPSPEMHANTMRALAQEHMQFFQKSAPGSVPTPEFLKPYLRDHAQDTQVTNHLSALSTAETGPLPIIHARRRSRPRSHMNQFAALGLAATFLMVLMMGGITSLLILAHDNATRLASISNTSSSSLEHTEILQSTFSTVTPYQHVISAVANRDNIYYSAYQDNDGTSSWMLLQLNRATKVSTPLLEQPTEQPIIVLGSTPQWVVWLQYDAPIVSPYKDVPNVTQHQVKSPWSLRILSLTQVAQASYALPPTILLNGTFDQVASPTWVHTPVQGIWFAQNVLLVALIDASGVSHLREYQLSITSKPIVTEIATGDSTHVFSSPTANSTATEIYWSDEWMSDNGTLNSNILMRQEITVPDAVRPSHGRWAGHAAQTTQQGVFRADGMSFRPQIADNTLFWLSTAPVFNAQTGTPTVTTTPQISTSMIPRAASAIYAPPLDASVRGQVLMEPLDSDKLTLPISLNNTGPAYALQVGADFALWQGDKGYEMYDVPTQNGVTTGTILNSAAFLAVNGDSAVWVADTSDTTANTSNTTIPQGGVPPVNIFAFNWPK